MKIYNKECKELKANGGILKDELGTFHFKPGYILHKDDSPAVEWTGDKKSWYYNGKCIIYTYGDVTPKQLLDFKLRIL